MGLSIVFHSVNDGDDGPFTLATTKGCNDLSYWIDSLLGNEFDTCKEMITTGNVKNTRVFAQQLVKALAAHPPTGSVRRTVTGLLRNLGVGDEDEYATIVD